MTTDEEFATTATRVYDAVYLECGGDKPAQIDLDSLDTAFVMLHALRVARGIRMDGLEQFEDGTWRCWLTTGRETVRSSRGATTSYSYSWTDYEECGEWPILAIYRAILRALDRPLPGEAGTFTVPRPLRGP